ncbi:MAG: hypothetical protein KatS3mg089_0873 [Patescibacteria group bacterium]|nr:MAG: hypothetical protein KatS3mg089_0873 [Patescibacteria group bacterium]
MVVPKLKLFQIIEEVSSRNTMVLEDSFFGKTSKAFQSVKMNVSLSHKLLWMIKSQVFSEEYQRILGTVLVRVKDTTFFRLPLNDLCNLGNSQFLRKSSKHLSMSFKHAQNKHLLSTALLRCPFRLPK